MAVEEVAVFTIRNLGGVSLLVLGSTFLWLTPMFATEGLVTKGAAWTAANVLSWATLLGFTIATWGLFQRAGWWESAALASAALGVAAVIPYWVAARHAGEAAPGFNAAIHLIGSAGVAVLLLVPSLQRWVDGHVMG
jgi:hypothetical protein